MRICAIGRLNLRKTSRRDDIDEGLQLVFGNGCAAKLDSLNVSSINSRLNLGDIGSKLKILQQIQNDNPYQCGTNSVLHMAYHYFFEEDHHDFYKTSFDCDDNEDMSNIEMSSDSDSRIVCNRCHTLLPAS
ncbi:hypothetical protein F2P79_021544 [Pimephales promelas]|nr:hypothetical protein F2P79_021544 [Pimephales promelas]